MGDDLNKKAASIHSKRRKSLFYKDLRRLIFSDLGASNLSGFFYDLDGKGKCIGESDKYGVYLYRKIGKNLVQVEGDMKIIVIFV